MAEDFSGCAVRLSGMAARLLGWTPDTFWNATPAELAASLGPVEQADAPPSRDEIAAMIERDRNGR
ncbi:phage tail assembly chaperone [Qipengyuania gelatinilytica]|uniref:Phage tail assembly chaperone n=1 Tax=Qipengyuania gelatinilytica TaxID=2867231 RepID=A0ABX8ZZ70_9SPHN|nr:phage tail assembly chaperone [Qipengyuania gelatinilytica]QZD94320.1 phage tail assembly chaperone [Qipengyuania gelatinilytica]